MHLKLPVKNVAPSDFTNHYSITTYIEGHTKTCIYV